DHAPGCPRGGGIQPGRRRPGPARAFPRRPAGTGAAGGAVGRVGLSPGGGRGRGAHRRGRRRPARGSTGADASGSQGRSRVPGRRSRGLHRPGFRGPVRLMGHVIVVVEENTDYSSVIGSSSMPYLNGLAQQYALATKYYAVTHPSIGNYFMMTVGKIITNDDSYSGVVSDDNIICRLIAAGKTWKSY